MKRKIKSIIALASSVTLLLGCILNLSDAFRPDVTYAEVTQKVNVGVDFNGTADRADCRHETFEDWIVQKCTEASYVYEEGGLTFTVKSTGEGGGQIYTSETKQLVNATGNSPLLTLDGLRCTTFNKGAITLEIAGLPAGEHTLTSWHSFNYITSSTKRGTMSVLINGETVESGVTIPCKVTDDNDAAILYNSFTVAEGETVVIEFVSDNNSGFSYNIPVLSAFEIDGIHPLKAIKYPYPDDGEKHFQIEKGFSWTAPEGAVSYQLYLGTDEYAVTVANQEYDEYIGETTETSFDASDIEFDHMKTNYWRADVVFEDGSVITGKVNAFNVAHLAFPSAEGYGRFAHGGRGGQILEVTTLEDGYVDTVDENGNTVKAPIEGSLRWAIESFTGPRIVVFNVGGVIMLESMLNIDGDHGDIYIAGQTAPGDGITICRNTFGCMGAEDVVIRDVRVRPGDYAKKGLGGMGMAGTDHSIIDHCSITWASDEGFSSRNAKNITLQWTIIGDSLNNSYHYTASESGDPNDRDPNATSPHGFAASIGGNKATFHHNLLANNTARNWSQAGGLESDGSYAGYLDIRYNLVYNWKYRTCEGGARQTQFVGNYYKMGPESRDINIYQIEGDEVGNSTYDPETGVRTGNWQMAYLEGNKMVDTEGNVLLDPVNDDPWKRATLVGLNMTESPEDSKSDVPFFESYVKESTADQAYEDILNDVGANVPALDYIDSVIVKDTREGGYTYVGSKDKFNGIIDSQDDVGGYPSEETFVHAVRPDDFDTDHDGMPDEWEELHGLDAENAADGNVITLSAEGYTNIEMYLNELMNEELVWLNEEQKPEPTATPEATEEPIKDIYNQSAKIRYDAEKKEAVITIYTKPFSTFGVSIYGDAECISVEYETSFIPSVIKNDKYIFAGTSELKFKDANGNTYAYLSGAGVTVADGSDVSYEGKLAKFKFVNVEPGTVFTVVNSAGYVDDITKVEKIAKLTAEIVDIEPTDYILGDVNEDGQIDAADALLVLKEAAKLNELDKLQGLAANVNKDDNIDAADALLILKYAARLIEEFE